METEFNRNIIIFKNHFWDFYNHENADVQQKIDWVIGLVKSLKIVPAKFFEHLSGTNGLWEIRIEFKSNIYRIFSCFDEGNVVVLFNAFQKKTQKTPKSEIEKALKLRAEYFEEKILRNTQNTNKK
jgi:phage-related protein